MPTIRNTLLAATSFMALAGGGLAHAEDARAEGEVDAVIVTGRSLEVTLPQELARYGADVETVGADRIAAGSYIDVSTALAKEVPGLFVSPAGGPYSYVDISLQGSRSSDVLWVIDGVRVSNRLYNGTQPDTLPAAMVDRIEVLKDGQGLYYGTQAVSGVINIVTKGFSDTPDGELRLGADSNQGWRASAFGRGAVGKHHFVAYASADKAEGYKQFDVVQPSAYDRKRGYDVTSAGLKYGYAISENLNLSAQYQHTDAENDLISATRTVKTVNKRDEELATARLDYTPDGPVQFFLKGYYHDWDTRYFSKLNSTTTPYVATVANNNEFWGYEDFGFNALAKLSLHKGADYFVGYDYQNYNGRDEVLLIADQTETVQALFGQVRTNDDFSEKLHLSAGARVNRSSADEKTSVWTASGRYDVTDALFVSGMVGTAFRLPDAYELFAVDPDDTRGNPNLKGEKSRNLNISVGGAVPGGVISWQVTGFKRRVEDLIGVFDDGSDNGVWANTQGEVRISGFEAIVRAQLAEGLSGQIAYTDTKARTAGAAGQRDRIPESFLKASLTWDPVGSRFGAGATINHVGANHQTVATFGLTSIGDYTTANLNGWAWLDDDHKTRLNLSVENVFDKTYGIRASRGTVDNTTSQRFLYRTLGLPRTVYVTLTRKL